MSIFRRTKHSVIALVAVMAINGFSQSSVTFNVDGASTVVPPSIYGVLMEILGRQFKNNGIYVGTSSSVPNTDGIRKDIIEGFKECGVTCAQWPGGCAAKGFDWSENKRKDFGVDRFIEFCKLCEMEPFIVGDAGNAPSNLAFMKYVIDSLKYPLKWFKVGNEVWDCGGKYNANSYSTQYSSNYDRLGSYAKEKNVKLIASISYGGGDDWINTLLNNNSGKIDGFEIHQYIYHPDDYSSTDPSTQQYWDVINLAYNGQIRSNLKRIVGTLNSKDPQNKVKIYFDEWGDWFKDLGDAWEQRITVLDALSAGEHLHAFMEYSNRFEMAGLAQAVNVIHSLMNINQSSGVMSKTTTFYVFKMYIPHHTNNAMQVPITAENWKKVNNNVQAVTSFASVDKDGIVSISFTNADISATQAVTVNLTSKIESYSVKSAEVITGPAINSYNEYGKDETVYIKPLSSSSYSLSGKTLNVTLPSKSVVMIRLQP
ncbi:MAG TPA: alpha-L-arabinofuranosidase C-terminal domain-containing protein, partial [Chitinispirillaceae bacterium]|nr:alpha-L-arabinofuranosidase C-terminal domain-containing protein [Chitinispirillaceae bacterium]